MEIIPVAFDSLGTRSMATFVRTKAVSIFIDPAVALGPSRYGLPPHKLEIKRKTEHWQEIKRYVKLSDVLIVTHYHYDHHNPDEAEIYKDKIVFLKDPQNNINRSQKSRAAYFLSQLNGIAREINISDGKTFNFGQTKIEFSDAVFHGTNPRLGYVTEVLIHDEQRFLFTSDVEGPSVNEQTNFILNSDPDIIFCDGPMTYMLGYKYSKQSLEKSISDIIKIIENTRVKKFVLDHHFTRDMNWRERIADVFDAAKKKGVEILTAASFLGKTEDLLEARRKKLFDTQ